MIIKNNILKHFFILWSVIALFLMGSLAYAHQHIDNSSSSGGQPPQNINAIQVYPQEIKKIRANQQRQLKIKPVPIQSSLKLKAGICTQELKTCSDGSYVSRIGPNCEFALCPNERDNDKRQVNRKNVFKNIKAERIDQVHNWKQKRDIAREEVIQLRTNIQDRRNEVKEKIKIRRIEIKEALSVAKSPEEKKMIINNAREENTQFKEKRKIERQELRQKVKEGVSIHMQQVLKRLDMMLNRLTNINKRIQSYLNKVSNKGIDTSDVQILLDTVKAKIIITKDQVHQVKILIEEAVNSEKPSNYRQIVRTEMKEIIINIKELKKILKDTIQTAKKLTK